MLRIICALLLLVFDVSAEAMQTDNHQYADFQKNSKSISAVILQYHHVSDRTPASTSVTPAQFKAQMQYIASHGFHVIPLSKLVAAIKANESLPAKTLVITFDDGYRSIDHTAHPILKEYGFPYTLFVAVEPIERRYGDMMSWQQLKELAKEGAEIANHSWDHGYLIRKLPNESENAWFKRIESNILKAEAKIKQMTGQDLKMLAYPYGEYNTKLQQMIAEHGFVAVGQQSGAAGSYSDLTALPRFPVAGTYADLASLKVKMNSLNMPVVKQNITNPELKNGQWRPELQVTLDIADIQPSQLMCFVQGQGAKKPVWLSENQFSIQADKDLPKGRSRYNCTARSKSSGNYYWFSQAWIRH